MNIDKSNKNLLFPDFDIGDLVRLNTDQDMINGLGIIGDIKIDFNDVYKINELLEKIEQVQIGIKISAESDGFFPTKSQALILWCSKKYKYTSSLWVYASEITLVKKVIKEST